MIALGGGVDRTAATDEQMVVLRSSTVDTNAISCSNGTCGSNDGNGGADGADFRD